jgi:SNF2 family DNA or RNA helicase
MAAAEIVARLFGVQRVLIVCPTSLNLQHASAVVNMDLPWNSAVLEQRIGRVHRLGQHKPVQVVNFIAQGTIEEGMLSALVQFKR